jgi:hypothetical protein
MDSGATWTAANLAVTNSWQAVAWSADGHKLAAVAQNGPIYSGQVPLALGIALSGPNALLSWPYSATGFVLEQNPDLTTTNWTEVTDAPALNLTNWQKQLNISPTAGQQFYRLRSH